MPNDLGQDSESTTETTAGGNPTPENATPTTEAAAAAATQDAALEQPIPAPSAEPVLVKGGMEGYQEMLAKATAGEDPFAAAPAAKEEPKPGELPAEAAPAATVDEAPPAVTTQETPPGEPDDGGVVPGKNFRPRLGELPDYEKEAIALRASMLREQKDVPLDECLRRVKVKYEGEAPPPDAAANQQPPVHRAEEAITAEIAALREERKNAEKNLDLVRVGEINDEIEAKRGEIAATREAQQHEFAVFQQQVAANNARAIELYPDAGVAGSEFHAAMIAMADRLEAQGNPLPHQPDGALKIAQMVANERGIAPATPGKAPVSKAAPAASKPSTPTKPQPVPQKAVGRVQTSAAAPASGAARTTPPGPPAPLPVPRTALAYDELVHQMTNR